MADTGVVGGKPAERQRGERVADRVEPVHPRELQRGNARGRDQEVDEPQRPGRLRDPGREFLVLHRAGCLGLVDLHATDPQQGEDRDHQDDDAHPAIPIERVTPEIDRRRQRVQADQHRGAGRAQTGHRLEEGVGESEAREGDQQRDGRNGRHQDPAERHEHEPVSRAQFALLSARRGPEQHPCGEARGRRDHEIDEMAVGVDQCGRDRQRIRDAEHHQHRPEDVQYRKHGQGAVGPRAVAVFLGFRPGRGRLLSLERTVQVGSAGTLTRGHSAVPRSPAVA